MAEGGDLEALALRVRVAELEADIPAKWQARQDEMQAVTDALRARVANLEALLQEALPWVGHMSDDPQYGLRTRIDAALSQTPDAEKGEKR